MRSVLDFRFRRSGLAALSSCLWIAAACAKTDSAPDRPRAARVDDSSVEIEGRSSRLLSCGGPPALPDSDPLSACGPANLVSNGCLSAVPNWTPGFWSGTALIEQSTVAMSTATDATLQSSVLDVNFLGGWAAPRHSHNSGLFVPLAPPAGQSAWPAGSVLRVEFDARSVSGSPHLQIHRPWGGAAGTLAATLTSSWQHFSVTLKLAHSTDSLVFSPVPAPSNGIEVIVPARFQLDNFVVSGTLPKPNPNPCDATNMFGNGCFASTTTALERRIWTGSTFIETPIEVASEASDAPAGSAPSLRVRFRSDIPATHSHVSGLYAIVAPPGGPYPDVNSALRVEFDAKRISGARYLQFTRPWGGGGAAPVSLNDTWTHHVATVRTNFSLEGLLLAPVPSASADLQVVQPGEFLIDNLVVKPAPSVLVIHRDHQIDAPVPKSLEGKGLVIDAVTYAELPNLSAAALSKYNVLWIESIPAAGDPGLSANAFQQLLSTHLAAGGGVLVSPSQFTPAAYRSTHDWLSGYGAALPLETLDLGTSVAKRRPIRLSANFFLTNSLASETELVAGASQVWFPEPFYNGGPHATTTSPILHDARWLPLLKAGRSVWTSPIDMVGWPAYDESWAAGIQQRCGAPDPTLLAVRDIGPGRLGVFRMLWSYHLAAGRSWADGVLLEKGFDSSPSDFERLLANTLHWLAEPTWRSGDRGGAVVPPDRFDPPLLKPGAAAPHIAETLQPVPTQPEHPVYRGVIGARTLAPGSSNVDQYIAAAQTAGHAIQFIAFLEDYASVGPGAISALALECQAKSTPSLQLFAGYRIETNLGSQYFVYGRDPPPVPADLMANGKLILEDTDASGFLNSSRVQEYFYTDVRKNGDVNTSGMFGLNSATSSLRLPFLKFMSAAGVKVYDSQLQLMEDHEQDYLLTNAGSSPLTPLAIHQITRHEKLIELLTRHDDPSDPARPYLTYAGASSVPNLFAQALRWSDFYFVPTVSVSNGPKVRLWSTMQRRWTFGGEDFVAQRNGALIPLRVSSGSGLDSIELYDGVDLVGKVKAGGVTDLNLELPMSTHLAQVIAALVTDNAGAKAISYPYNSLKDASPTPAFCRDHVNDCAGMRLARGAFWPGPSVLPVKQELGEAWDGAQAGTLAPVYPGPFSPAIFSGSVTPFTPYQIPRLELADERAYRGGADVLYSVPYGFGLPWQAWGPVTPANQLSGNVRVTEFQQYTKRVIGTNRHGTLLGGTRAALYDESITLGPQNQITGFAYTHDWRSGALPLDVRFAIGRDANISSQGRVSSAATQGACGVSDGCSEFSGARVETGDWIAAYSTEQPGSANAWLLVNRGPAFLVNLVKNEFSLRPATLNSPGTLALNLLTVGWEVENPINGLGDVASRDALVRHVQYLKDHGNVSAIRPTTYDASTLGLIAVQAAASDGYVELSAPRSASNVEVSLPVVVSGLQPRWSVWLLQKRGYNGAQYYGGSVDRVRPLGVVRSGSAAGRSYFSLYTSQADHHVLAGHPVVADGASALFINVVAASADAQGKPTAWYVAVNNPTNAPITATLRPGIPNLPGFVFAPKAVTLQPGQLIFRNANGAWSDAVTGAAIP